MCLLIKDKTPQIAKNDIVCYKVMLNKDGIIATPYRLVIPKTDVLNGTRNFKATDSTLTAEELINPVNFQLATAEKSDVGTIENGYIHTFMFASHAVEDIGTDCFARKDYLLYRCIIPKGTEYFVGRFCGYPCYASREIKFEGIID